jgi:hypothetical protein
MHYVQSSCRGRDASLHRVEVALHTLECWSVSWKCKVMTQAHASAISRMSFAIPKAILTGFPSVTSGSFFRSVWVNLQDTWATSFVAERSSDDDPLFGLSTFLESSDSDIWYEHSLSRLEPRSHLGRLQVSWLVAAAVGSRWSDRPVKDQSGDLTAFSQRDPY